MNIRDIVKAAIRYRGYTQNQAAKVAGLGADSSIHYILNKPKISIDEVFHILDSLEYDIIIKDKKGTMRWKVGKL